MPLSAAWSLLGVLNTLATLPFVWKVRQLGVSGFESTTGPRLWAGTHDCVVVCCIMSPTALSLSFHGDARDAVQFLPASSDVASLRDIVRQLVDLCHGNQREIRSLREEISQIRSQLSSRLASPPSSCSFTTCPVRFCQAHCTSPRCPTHSTAPRRRGCRARGCTSLVPRSCSSGFCESHCTSLRCTLHRRRAPVFSTVGCTADEVPKCVVGSCRAHCTHTPCGPIGGGPRSTLRLCRIQSCSERLHPECSTRCCTLHCFTRPQTGRGREPGEHPTSDPIACSTRGHFQRTTLAPRKGHSRRFSNARSHSPF